MVRLGTSADEESFNAAHDSDGRRSVVFILHDTPPCMHTITFALLHTHAHTHTRSTSIVLVPHLN